MWLVLGATLADCLLLHSRSSDTYYASPFFPEGPNTFNVTAVPVLLPDLWSPALNRGEVAGMIGVLTGEDMPGAWREDYVHRAQEVGLVGLVGWTTWVPDHFGDIDLSPRELLHIPFVSILVEDLESIKVQMQEGNTTMSLLSGDSVNPWTVVFDSVFYQIFFRVPFIIFSVVLAMLCLHRLFRWARYYRLTKSVSKIAVISLLLEFICNFLRIVYFSYGGIFACRTVAFPPMRILYTCTASLGFITTALTVAYIHEVLTARSALGTMVEKTRKPLLALSAFYILTDWPITIVSALRLYAYAAQMATICGAFMTVGQVVTALLLLYITFKLRFYVKSVSSSSLELSERPLESPRLSARLSPRASTPAPPLTGVDRLKILLRRVQHSTYWMLFNTAAFATTLSPTFSTPEGFVVSNAFIFLGAGMVSLLHILAYGRTPPVKRPATFPRVKSGPRASSTFKASTGSQGKTLVEVLETKEEKDDKETQEDSSAERSKSSKQPKQLSVVLPEDNQRISVVVSPLEGAQPVSEDFPRKASEVRSPSIGSLGSPVEVQAASPRSLASLSTHSSDSRGRHFSLASPRSTHSRRSGEAAREEEGGLREGLLGAEGPLQEVGLGSAASPRSLSSPPKSRSSHSHDSRSSVKSKKQVGVEDEGDEPASPDSPWKPKHKHKPSENYEPLE